MAGVSSTQSLRKAIGVIKDSTKVGLAKVNSEYKDLDIAIVKATNHVERIAKEKHIRTIFAVAKASRPRADVAYCVYALARRLSKTHNWAVALKTLVVIHRALREVDSSFREELINYTKSRGHVLNLSHFKDDSSPTAWDYSAWVRVYALYLEERLECFRILNYDIEADRPRMRELDTPDLLEQLPALQRLFFRLLACQPEGAARYNNVIQYALSLVASESVRIYAAISDATLNLVDKFFEMQQHDAVRALELYKKTGNQAERLSEFYEICRGLEFGKRQKFIKIEQPPASFLATMEEYVKEAPRPLVLQNMGNDDRGDTKTEGESNSVLSIKPKSDKQVEDGLDLSVREPEASTTMSSEAPVTSPFIDLLGLDEINQDTSEVEENNPLALALINSDDQLNATNGPAEFTGWELALVTAPSKETAVAESKLAGGLDKLTLDSLYEDAMARTTNQNRIYHTGQAAPNPFETAEYMDDPFYASSDVGPPTNVQMESTTDQHQDFMMEQQQQNQHPLSAQQQQDFTMEQHQDFMMEPHQDLMMEQQQQYQQPPSQQQEQDFTSDQHQDFMMEQHRDFMMEQQQLQYQQPLSAHQRLPPPVVSQNPTNPFGDPYEEHDVSSTGHSQNPCNYF